jgi:DNA invertase Pin-like site-specific DNA recombinase
MRLVGYVRRSVANGDGEDGLEGQREAIREWASAQGHELVGGVNGFEGDDGISGTKSEDERPGLARALEAFRSGEVEGLVVHRADRLARSLTVAEVILAKVWEGGGRVFTVDGEILQDDPSDPLRRALRQMAGVFAELERNMTVARTQAGRRRRAAQGKHLGGRRPYGFQIAEDGVLVLDKAEQRKLRRARQMRDDGMSFRQIGDRIGLPGESVRRILLRQQQKN